MLCPQSAQAPPAPPSLASQITLALAFSRGEIEKLHIFFGVAILMISAPQFVLVYWFRNGDLHPKFRYLIGYMMVSIILLCVIGIVYFYHEDKVHEACHPDPP